jgi:hypothetical protein
MTVKTQKAYMVSVPPRSSAAEIHTAISAVNGDQSEIHLMAGSLDFATPKEVCGLRALIDHAATRADRVVFDCPSRRDVHAYLARANFYADLPPNVQLSRPPPVLRRRNRRLTLLELIRVVSTEDVEGLMDLVYEVAKGQFGIGPVATACTTAIGAAIENVVEHADSPIGALVSAQRYRRFRRRRANNSTLQVPKTGLELAVVDLGQGIPTTLSRHPNHRGLSDLEALERSLEDGVSSTSDPGRGAGLAELVGAVGRTGHSTLELGSGRASLTLEWANGNHYRQRAVPGYTIRGTWISLRLEA